MAVGTPSFPIPSLGWTARRLSVLDLPELQSLFVASEDFFQLTEGAPAGPHAAQVEWEALPPERGRAHKHLWGLGPGEGPWVGCLEAVEGYPIERTCWLGLLLLHPQARGQGQGRRVVEAFQAWVQARGHVDVQLAVVEANAAALRFWTGLGYELHRTVEDRIIGLKTHRLQVLGRMLR